jgi:hypothetical protein
VNLKRRLPPPRLGWGPPMNVDRCIQALVFEVEREMGLKSHRCRFSFNELVGTLRSCGLPGVRGLAGLMPKALMPSLAGLIDRFEVSSWLPNLSSFFYIDR